ncbi:SPOR domain-containing protein [Guptibacillus hwajinpoensis]|uniref:SPOR domain-containing protein n=1 Tax=Guptibacillus hwajinpoensis TaxID=208199 RepID=UPI003D6B445C
MKKLNVRSFRLKLAEQAALAAVKYLNGKITSIYLVQTGAFKEKEKANQLCEELKRKGYAAFIKREG